MEGAKKKEFTFRYREGDRLDVVFKYLEQSGVKRHAVVRTFLEKQLFPVALAHDGSQVDDNLAADAIYVMLSMMQEIATKCGLPFAINIAIGDTRQMLSNGDLHTVSPGKQEEELVPSAGVPPDSAADFLDDFR